MKTNMKKLFYFVLIIILTNCATTLELYTYPVTKNSSVLNKTVSSLNWIDSDKVKILKVKRNGKDILKIYSNFKFAENDTVYILGKSSDRKYIKMFFE